MVEAVLRPHQLDAVKSALTNLGVQGMTVSEVRGGGKGRAARYRGNEYVADAVSEMKIEIVVGDSVAAVVRDAILSTARLGDSGEGSVSIYPLEAVYRIRSGEEGPSAV